MNPNLCSRTRTYRVNRSANASPIRELGCGRPSPKGDLLRATQNRVEPRRISACLLLVSECHAGTPPTLINTSLQRGVNAAEPGTNRFSGFPVLGQRETAEAVHKGPEHCNPQLKLGVNESSESIYQLHRLGFIRQDLIIPTGGMKHFACAFVSFVLFCTAL